MTARGAGGRSAAWLAGLDDGTIMRAAFFTLLAGTLGVLYVDYSELTAGELRTRGYYLGSNVSYNLKKLVETGYIHHQRSRMDRRSVRVSLTDKGQEVAAIVDGLYERHIRSIHQVGGIAAEDFQNLNRSLQRLERFWTDQILYRL